ncbi:hypothetical protein Dac01nite_05310 [Demequina activiva]|uniref:Nucleotidyltransferase n=2 Tax=Demequina activiva TaxID=1582364 RepID=A0A919Q0J6_9MICO|nr:hypothetical protein Dac01nite_05310 [Demequina activiva]
MTVVATRARRLGVRALVIKGAVADHHRLRPERVSADVDVLVEPLEAGEFVHSLEGAGWSGRPETSIATEASAHSVTMVHPHWPCDIDVHHEFPGMLAGPHDAFDALWDERSGMSAAGIDVDVAGPLGSILISALHSLRHDTTVARYAAELVSTSIAVRELAPRDRDALGALAVATGAAGPLREWLRAEGIDVAVASTPSLVDWETRRHSGDTFAGQFVATFARAPWRERPRLLVEGIWPDAAEMRATHPEIGPHRRDLLRARLSRVGRGLRDAPRALRSLATARSRSRR